MNLIAIDPGHGTPDPGVLGLEATESEINLSVAWKLAKLLEEERIRSAITRPFSNRLVLSDGSQDLSYRTSLANKLKADLFVSIHCNGAVSKAARGHETFYHSSSVKGYLLATEVDNQIKKNLKKMPFRGVKSDKVLYTNGLYVLRHTVMPAILVELGFLSNTKDEGLLTDNHTQWILADSIKSGILNYLNQA